jgi:hypothetical protein
MRSSHWSLTLDTLRVVILIIFFIYICAHIAPSEDRCSNLDEMSNAGDPPHDPPPATGASQARSHVTVTHQP